MFIGFYFFVVIDLLLSFIGSLSLSGDGPHNNHNIYIPSPLATHSPGALFIYIVYQNRLIYNINIILLQSLYLLSSFRYLIVFVLVPPLGSRSGNVTPGGHGHLSGSRPGSAMSTSTTLSTSGGGLVPRRPATAPRKPRPASIAGTGMSLEGESKTR